MSLAKVLLLVALFAAGWGPEAYAGKRTVCTITVNSPDEKEMFRQRLPEDQYEFVELVERGRPDWLAAACRDHIRCDLLIISGHFDGSTEFYSDQTAASEFLPVAEMERASCSDSCPGLFSQLKEVYLFGCNTLNADAIRSTSSEAGRSLVRDGHSRAAADRIARALDQRHGESSRDRMRRIFVDVPVIYGFSSVAPLGPTAATLLGRYLRSPSSTASVGGGRVDPGLLAHFASESMVAVGGLNSSDPHAGYRRDVCQFMDERPSAPEKLRFIHGLLQRDTAEIRMFLERIEGQFASWSEIERQDPEFSAALRQIALDDVARDRFLRFANDADQPQIRARMIKLAGALGWLSPAELRIELVRMISDLLEKGRFGPAEVDLTCALNSDHELDGERPRLSLSPLQAGEVTHAAAWACLGSAAGRARVLQAVTSRDDAEVQIAEVYLGRRPITNIDELRVVTSAIAHMTGSGAQVRALDTLARHHVSDRQSLNELVGLFPLAGSVEVQRAIAAVLIRADVQAIAKPEVARLLSEHRLKSPTGDDIIDILIRRLRAS